MLCLSVCLSARPDHSPTPPSTFTQRHHHTTPPTTTGEGWEGFLQPPKYQNVYMDTHFYLLFDPNLWQSTPKELTNYVCQVHACLHTYMYT